MASRRCRAGANHKIASVFWKAEPAEAGFNLLHCFLCELCVLGGLCVKWFSLLPQKVKFKISNTEFTEGTEDTEKTEVSQDGL